jgi:hypothetical protein
MRSEFQLRSIKTGSEENKKAKVCAWYRSYAFLYLSLIRMQKHLFVPGINYGAGGAGSQSQSTSRWAGGTR